MVIIASLVLAFTQVALAASRQEHMAKTLAGCKNYMRDTKYSRPYSFDEGFCTGAIAGIYEAAEDICEAEGVTFDQQVLVVIKYIEERPQRLHELFAKLAYEALKEAWPCNR